MARRKVKNDEKKKVNSFSPPAFFTFLRAIFFRPFRLSLALLYAPGSPRTGVVNPIDTDFGHQSIEIDKEKSCDFDTIDFAIEVNNNRFIDCYQLLNLVSRVLSY